MLGAELGVDARRLVGDLLDEVGAPVPLVARRVEPVEGALQRRVRHRRRRRACSGSGTTSSSGAIAAAAVLLVADVAPDDAADLAQVELLGEGRRRRHGVEGEEAVQLARRAGQELAVGRAAPRRRARPARTSGRPTTVPTSCSRKMNEVTTPKLPPPPRIAQKRSGFSSALARTLLAVGEHELRLEQVVDREPALAGQVADAAAERQAADAGGRDDPARRREAVLVRGRVDLAPGAAAADPDGARLRDRPRSSFSGERSITTPSSQCRGRRRCGRRRGRRAAGRGRGRSATAAATSSASAQRAISAGRLSIIAL